MEQEVRMSKKKRSHNREAEEKLKKREEALRQIAAMECNCDGWCGPCGCGERMKEIAEEALEP